MEKTLSGPRIPRAVRPCVTPSSSQAGRSVPAVGDVCRTRGRTFQSCEHLLYEQREAAAPGGCLGDSYPQLSPRDPPLPAQQLACAPRAVRAKSARRPGGRHRPGSQRGGLELPPARARPLSRCRRALAAPPCAGASPGAQCAGAGREDRQCAGLELVGAAAAARTRGLTD